jgi:uncharacterized membrane protein YjgN (DUF898 family)
VATRGADVTEYSATVPAAGRGHFHGTKAEYRRILWRDMFALVVTLGLYRFWVTNNIRRHLWSRTELAGQQLDYNGDPKELLIGFLVLLVALAPIIIVTAMLGWIAGFVWGGELAIGGLPLGDITPYTVLGLLIPLAVLTLYQARRYRLHHTVFRGLCFRQTGSVWGFVLRSVLWSAVVLATLGFAYPWARADIERYKMRQTWYGDIHGRFEGSGGELFKRGFLIWLVSLILLAPAVPLYVTTARLDAANDPGAIAFLTLLILDVGGVSLVVYPFLRARVVRWRIAGMRFGALSFTSDFSTWKFAKPYFKFYAWLLLIAVVVSLLGVILYLIQAVLLPMLGMAWEVVGVISALVMYFSTATIITFAFQGTVRFETWRLIVDSLVLHGVDQLDRAKSSAGTLSRRDRAGAAINLGGF